MEINNNFGYEQITPVNAWKKADFDLPNGTNAGYM
jgi:hypothetical protein